MPQALSWFIAAVLQTPSRWQHSPAVSSLTSPGLLAESGFGLWLIPSILLRSSHLSAWNPLFLHSSPFSSLGHGWLQLISHSAQGWE